jgi:hypothetical protein
LKVPYYHFAILPWCHGAISRIKSYRFSLGPQTQMKFTVTNTLALLLISSTMARPIPAPAPDTLTMAEKMKAIQDGTSQLSSLTVSIPDLDDEDDDSDDEMPPPPGPLVPQTAGNFNSNGESVNSERPGSPTTVMDTDNPAFSTLAPGF